MQVFKQARKKQRLWPPARASALVACPVCGKQVCAAFHSADRPAGVHKGCRPRHCRSSCFIARQHWAHSDVLYP